MRLPFRVLALVTIPACLIAHANSAAAQDFDDRWSIIPKAHADPAPAVPPESLTSPDQSVIEPAPGHAVESRSPHRSFNRIFSGKASYYSYSKGKTASGAPFNREALTAAHRNLPFGTRVRVTDLKSSKSVVVRISDRGPWIRGRVLDLSFAAARTLGITDRGVADVRVEVL